VEHNTLTVRSAAEAAGYRDLIRQYGSPLLMLDCDIVRRQYRALSAALPGVGLYYAVKSLPQPTLLSVLAEEGAGFDLATSGEIELARSLGINARQTIHTHPIKRDSDIRDALRYGCTTFVVDNADEIDKFRRYRRRVGLMLRVSFRSPSASVDLSKKFGCAVDEVPRLLARARMQGIHVKGLSFHVGSQSANPDTHVRAVKTCAEIIRNELDGDAPLSLLDIGGGFPANYGAGAVDIDAFCAPIREALTELPEGITVIAEPGRFISGPSMQGLFSVIGRAERDGRPWYYLDDGVYGSFSGQIFDHVRYPLDVFSDSDERRASVLTGPTCDSIDVVAEDISLPPMQIGDFLLGHEMGAYTAATSTEFNAIPRTQVIALNREEALSQVG
jgi:ornithine decarboxylase